MSRTTSILNVTAFQKMLHGETRKQQVRHLKTHGAFGGATRETRLVKRLVRRLQEK